MPASVYRVVVKDSEMKKLAPSSLEIGTYTTDTEKVVGSCMVYLVHLDNKKMKDVTFFVAANDGSMLLSCKTTLMLGLIQPMTRLDYLPPRASLITNSADHPKKTKSTLCVQKQKVSHSKTYTWTGHSNTKTEVCSYQAGYKQRTDFAWITSCLWRDW